MTSSRVTLTLGLDGASVSLVWTFSAQGQALGPTWGWAGAREIGPSCSQGIAKVPRAPVLGTQNSQRDSGVE